MTSLAARVLASIRRRRLCDPHARIVAAVSGGADSVALAHLLAELSHAGALTLVGVAHLDHRLRGDESDRDREFCAALAANLRLPFDVEQIDVLREAERRGESIEQAARAVRYEFLERARARLGADRVAVAHTRDDQAETVLLRLLRGAGTRGLAAILPVSRRRDSPADRHPARRDRAIPRGATGTPGSRTRPTRTGGFCGTGCGTTCCRRSWRATGDGVIDVLARTADSAREDEALLGAMALRSRRPAAARGGRPGRAGRRPPAPRAAGDRAARRAAPARVGGAAARDLGARRGGDGTGGGDAGRVQAGRLPRETFLSRSGLIFQGPRDTASWRRRASRRLRPQRPPAPDPARFRCRACVDLPESGLRLRAERRDSGRGRRRARLCRRAACPGR